MKSCIIQGASRGIGYEFTRNLLTFYPSLELFACCRKPKEAHLLNKLKENKSVSERLHIIELDNTIDKTIHNAFEEISSKSPKGIELLMNTSGILHPSGRGETSIAKVNRTDLLKIFNINTIGNLLVCKAFLPLLSKNTYNHLNILEKADSNIVHGAIVNISARIGSIGDNNGLGGWYGYRMSKAALNMANKTLSLELGRDYHYNKNKKKIIVVGLHPGTVQTDFSRLYWENKKSNIKNIFTVEESVQYMLNVIKSLNINDTGKFFDYNKKEIPF